MRSRACVYDLLVMPFVFFLEEGGWVGSGCGGRGGSEKLFCFLFSFRRRTCYSIEDLGPATPQVKFQWGFILFFFFFFLHSFSYSRLRAYSPESRFRNLFVLLPSYLHKLFFFSFIFSFLLLFFIILFLFFIQFSPHPNISLVSRRIMAVNEGKRVREREVHLKPVSHKKWA